MARRIQLRRDTSTNWISANPVLAQGEIGIDLTNKKIKLGDGVNAWNSLAYFDDKETVLSNYAGDIVPSADDTYTLGTPEKRWKDVFVTEGSIYIGDVKLSNNNGTLVINRVTDGGLETEEVVEGGADAVQVDLTGLATEDYVDQAVGAIEVPADIGDLTDTQGLLGQGGSANTGDITFTNSTISAGSNDEVVVQAIDADSFATARLNLEPEYSTAKLSAFSGESVQTFTSENGDFATGVWQDNGFGNGVVSFTEAQNIGDFFQNTLQVLNPNNVTITINSEPSFTWNGGTSGSGTSTPGFGTNPIVPESPITITSISFSYRQESYISVNYDNQEIRLDAQNAGIRIDATSGIQMYGDSEIDLQADAYLRLSASENIDISTGSSYSVNISTGDFIVSAFDDINIRGNDSFRLRNESSTAPIRIITDDNNNEYTWAFNADGSLTFPDASVQTTAYTGAGASTGDITFNGVKIIGAGTASGDGNGYSTLELVPDNSLYENNQYLVIDPTVPTHIHIRAGGTQDSSNAELFLGGEKNHVRVTDFGGVELQNQNVSTPSYFYSDVLDFTNGSWYENDGVYYIEYTSINAELDSKAFDNIESITVNYSSGSDNLTYAGSASNLGNGTYRVQVNEAPPDSPTVLTSIEYYIFLTRTNTVSLESNDFTVFVTDDIRITGSDRFRLINESSDESIQIITNNNATSRNWDFGADGNLLLPDGGELVFNSGGLAGKIVPSVSDGTGLQIEATLDFEIKVNDGQGGSNIWSFAGSDITFPDGGILKVGTPPATSFGQEGDKAGTVAFNGSYIYYCTANHSTTPVVVLWSNIMEVNDGLGDHYLQADIVDPTLLNGPLSITNISVNGAPVTTETVTSFSQVSGNTYKFYLANSEPWQSFQSSELQVQPHIWRRIAWSNDTW